MAHSKQCPCGSGQPYAVCCEPLLSGHTQATAAEALMRSRYTAYAERNIGYLLRTWHPSTRPSILDPSTMPDWCSLEILRTERGGAGDVEGVVEFVATALLANRFCKLREASRFVREEGLWYYLDGDMANDGESVVADIAKVGRNDPCPCGSGRKFKKCCGR